MATPNEFLLTVEGAGVRLDKFVAENCPGVSRSLAQKLIEAGRVTVDGRPEKASYKLTAGENVKVVTVTQQSHLTAEDIPVKILYEDNDVLVVDKPPGMTVHPAPGSPAHTLVNAVLGHLQDAEGSDERPGIVHRLDKDTSGVMLVARNPAAMNELTRQFRERTVKKVYLVLVRGKLTPETGIIEAPIGRDSGDRKKMAVTAESRGRSAKTSYRVLRYLAKSTYLEVMPETGRTHQIRVHLAAIGYPVLGDTTYGLRSPHVPRQFVHAHKISFNLPSTGERVEFTSPLPEDLERALREME